MALYPGHNAIFELTAKEKRSLEVAMDLFNEATETAARKGYVIEVYRDEETGKIKRIYASATERVASRSYNFIAE